jgi:hypothetical protein
MNVKGGRMGKERNIQRRGTEVKFDMSTTDPFVWE